MKKIIYTIIVFLLIILSSCDKGDIDSANAKKLLGYNREKFDKLPLSGKVVNGVREIEIKAFQFNWEPENIVVKKGEKLKLTIESMDVPHGFELEGLVIPGYDINKLIMPGTKEVIEFTPQDKGTWDLVCTGYCGTGHATMKGMFIVRE